MPARCSVPGCKSNYRDSKLYVPVYSFPKDNGLRRKWCKAIGREGWTPTKYSTVCRNHFRDRDIVNNVSWYDSKKHQRVIVPLSQTRVKENAVPSVFDNLFPIDPVSKRIIRIRKPKKIKKSHLTRVVFPLDTCDVKDKADDKSCVAAEVPERPKKIHLRKLLGLSEDDQVTHEPVTTANELKKNSLSLESNQQMNAATAANILLELNSTSGVPEDSNERIDYMDKTTDESSSSIDYNSSEEEEPEVGAFDVLPKVILESGKIPEDVTVKIFNTLQQIIMSNCDYQPVGVSESCSTTNGKCNRETVETNLIVYESSENTELNKSVGSDSTASVAVNRNCEADDGFDMTKMSLCVTKDVIENVCNTYNNIANYKEILKGVTDEPAMFQMTKQLNFYITFTEKNEGAANEHMCVISPNPVTTRSILCTYKCNRPFRKRLNSGGESGIGSKSDEMKSHQRLINEEMRNVRRVLQQRVKRHKDDSEFTQSDEKHNSNYNLRHRKINFKELVGMTSKDQQDDDSSSSANIDNANKKRKICNVKVKSPETDKVFCDTLPANRVYIETDHCDEDEYEILRYHKLAYRNIINAPVKNVQSPMLNKEIRIVLEKCDGKNFRDAVSKKNDDVTSNDIFNGADDTGVVIQNHDDEIEETIENIKLFVAQSSAIASNDNYEDDVTCLTIEDSKENVMNEINSIMSCTPNNRTENAEVVLTDIKVDRSDDEYVDITAMDSDVAESEEHNIRVVEVYSEVPTVHENKECCVNEVIDEHNVETFNKESNVNLITMNEDGATVVLDEELHTCRKESDETTNGLKNGLVENNLTVSDTSKEVINEDGAAVVLDEELHTCRKESDETTNSPKNGLVEDNLTVSDTSKEVINEDGAAVVLDEELHTCRKESDETTNGLKNGLVEDNLTVSDTSKEVINEDGAAVVLDEELHTCRKESDETTNGLKNGLVEDNPTISDTSKEVINVTPLNCDEATEKSEIGTMIEEDKQDDETTDEITIKAPIQSSENINNTVEDNEQIVDKISVESNINESTVWDTNDDLSTVAEQNGAIVCSPNENTEDKIEGNRLNMNNISEVSTKDMHSKEDTCNTKVITEDTENIFQESTCNEVGTDADAFIMASEMTELVFQEVTVCTDSPSSPEVPVPKEESDNVLHEFITINKPNEEKRKEVVPSNGVSSLGAEGFTIIEKEIDGLVDEDSVDNVTYRSAANDVVIVEGFVDDIIEYDDDDDDKIDEPFPPEDVIYCMYNESNNTMESVSGNIIMRIVDSDSIGSASIDDESLNHVDASLNDQDDIKLEYAGDNVTNLLTDKCNICHEEIHRVSMIRHLKRHTGVKFCPYCSKSYSDIIKYNEHVGRHKNNEGNEKYMCFICRRKFCFLKNIYKHLRNAHPNDTQHNDTIILLPDNGNNNKNNIFVKEKKIKRRMKSCPICNQLVTSFYYKRHLLSHSGERPFACPICDKRFYEKSTLKNHIRTHTGERPYRCEYCGKSFGHISTLSKHLNIHTGAKKFQCSTCSKFVSSSYNLKLHYRTHTGEKPFVCEICGKHFASKAALDKHSASLHAS